MTLLLVAHDGEWTRRRVPSVKWAHEFANQHQVPSYDAAVVGVPQRMRDYNRAQEGRGDLSARPRLELSEPGELDQRGDARSRCRPAVTWP